MAIVSQSSDEAVSVRGVGAKLISEATVKEYLPIPPKSGENSTCDVGHHIPRIACGPPKQVGTDDFKQDAPDDEIEGDLSSGGDLVVRP